MSEIVSELTAAYDKVKEWPENSETGFMDLLALRNLVPEAISELDRLREALKRQSDNMAFVVNHMTMHDSWYEKFQRELEEDRAALNPTGAS